MKTHTHEFPKIVITNKRYENYFYWNDSSVILLKLTKFEWYYKNSYQTSMKLQLLQMCKSENLLWMADYEHGYW